MNKYKKYNLDKIVSIKLLRKRPSDIVWRYGKKILGITISHSGFYMVLPSIYVNKSYIKNNNFIIENKKVYKKPVIIFTFVNGDIERYFYETDTRALEEYILLSNKYSLHYVNNIDKRYYE